MIRTILVGGAALMLAFAITGSTLMAAKPSDDGVHRLVIHLTSNDKGAMNRAINNARNLTQHYGVGNVEIEIVTNGPGLDLFHKDSPLRDRLAGIHAYGNIKFAICANTMKGRKWTKADLLADAFAQEAIVPAGVVRVIELQEAGWAYSRP